MKDKFQNNFNEFINKKNSKSAKLNTQKNLIPSKGMMERFLIPCLLMVFFVPRKGETTCTSTTIGQRKCVRQSNFNGYQWTTCVTKEYIEEKSQGALNSEIIK